MDPSTVGCAARASALLAVVPGSWCPLIAVTVGPSGINPVADLVFELGAVGFLLLLGNSLALGELSGRLADARERERVASWAALSARTKANREVVEGATSRADARSPVGSGGG